MEQEFGDRLVILQAEVSDAASIKRLSEQAGDVDILVNNAGAVGPASSLDENAEATLSKEVDINDCTCLRVTNGFAEIL